MDDQQRIALVRVGSAHPDDRGPAVQLHLGDHLGSSNVVVDSAGGLVDREDLTPYGETSFGSYRRKRYRFIGKERDEESGLTYHGARHYAAPLGRWVSADPAGPADATGLYEYARSNPMSLRDASGRDSESQIDRAIRAAEQQRRGHTERANRLQAAPTSTEKALQAGRELATSFKWENEKSFLETLKAVHETQRGVPLSYDRYPVTKKDPDTGAGGANNPWRHTPHRQSFAGTGEAQGSFCLGTSRGIAFRTTFGLSKPAYRQTLTDLKSTIETAKRSGAEADEARAIISRLASHLHDPGSMAQFNADLESRYGVEGVKIKSADRKEAFDALAAGAPVLADLSGGWHWVVVHKSPQGQLWANDPLEQGASGIKRISPGELGIRFEVIVDATTGTPIVPAQAHSYEKGHP